MYWVGINEATERMGERNRPRELGAAPQVASWPSTSGSLFIRFTYARTKGRRRRRRRSGRMYFVWCFRCRFKNREVGLQPSGFICLSFLFFSNLFFFSRFVVCLFLFGVAGPKKKKNRKKKMLNFRGYGMCKSWRHWRQQKLWETTRENKWRRADGLSRRHWCFIDLCLIRRTVLSVSTNT